MQAIQFLIKLPVFVSQLVTEFYKSVSSHAKSKPVLKMFHD